MKPNNFLDILRQDAKETGNIICMGLDPIFESLPVNYQKWYKKGDLISGAEDFYNNLFEEMKKENVFPATLKPNEGFWSKYIGGYETLCLFLTNFISFASKVPTIIIDAKRGDIGKSSKNYAEQYFKHFSATTASPFMGTDSVEPFTAFCNNNDGKGVYILNLTPNPGSLDFQRQKMADGRFLYEHVAEKIAGWAKNRPGVGAVIGATRPDELTTLLAFYAGKDIPVLVSGVGSQGGSAKEVVTIARQVGFELPLLRINSSSGLTHPWYKKPGDPIPTELECYQQCIHAFKTLQDEIGSIQ